MKILGIRHEEGEAATYDGGMGEIADTGISLGQWIV